MITFNDSIWPLTIWMQLVKYEFQTCCCSNGSLCRGLTRILSLRRAKLMIDNLNYYWWSWRLWMNQNPQNYPIWFKMVQCDPCSKIFMIARFHSGGQSQGSMEISRVKGNLKGRGKSRGSSEILRVEGNLKGKGNLEWNLEGGGDGFPDTSLVLVEHWYNQAGLWIS